MRSLHLFLLCWYVVGFFPELIVDFSITPIFAPGEICHMEHF